MDLQKIIEALLEYITPTRKNTLMDVLSYRTRHISVMLENIYQSHNASAVLRSCDAYGVQDVHVIEQHNTFNPNKEIAMGSAKWLSIHRHTETVSEAYSRAREHNYKIIATTLQGSSMSLDEIDITQPIMLVFGNELKGLSEEAIESADERMNIPMFGFVESFNISVSVAIALSHLVSKLHHLDIDWKLSEAESQQIFLDWLRSDIHKSEEIEARIFSDSKL